MIGAMCSLNVTGCACAENTAAINRNRTETERGMAFFTVWTDPRAGSTGDSNRAIRREPIFAESECKLNQVPVNQLAVHLVVQLRVKYHPKGFSMRLLHIGLAFALATVSFADTITLKSGRVINGTYLGGTARQVRVEVGDQIQTLNVGEISRIEFGGGSASNSLDNEQRPALRRNDSAPVEEPRPALRRADSQANVMRPENAPPPPAPSRGSVELPAGTNVVVRMIDGVDSETARVGQTFQGSLDEPIMLNGQSVVPRGADVTLKLVDSKDSGKFTGRAELT